MRKIFCAALMLIAISAHGAPRDGFEGTWTITVTPEEGLKTWEDTLTFKGVKLTSKYFEERGFRIEYESDARGVQTATFTAVGKSEKEGKTAWSGTSALGQITGTVKWTKADGSEVTLSFKGQRAEK